MALFETKNVTLALDTLTITNNDDRGIGFLGLTEVEPYVIPVFFKVDGEGYEAVLRIFNTIQPREGTTEVEQPGFVQFNVNSLQENVNEVERDNPFIFVPPGNLLGRGSFDAGDEVDISDLSFNTDLTPIPFKIDILGIANQEGLLNRLQELLVNEPGLGTFINLALFSINSFLSALIGLDETFESCPSVTENLDDFLNNIEAQFNCVIPGTVGAVFVCMENDDFSESHAQDLQDSIRTEIESVINDTVNAIALNNPIPDPDRHVDSVEIEENIISDLTWPVILDIGLSIGLLVFGILTWNVVAAVWGFFSALSWAFGGTDDFIGQHQVSFSHSNLVDGGTSIPIDHIMEEEEGDNEWRIRGSFTAN